MQLRKKIGLAVLSIGIIALAFGGHSMLSLHNAKSSAKKIAQSKNPVVNRVGKDMMESTKQFDQEINGSLLTGAGLIILGACLAFLSSKKRS